MNRSQHALGRAGLLAPCGPPICRACAGPMEFGSDRDGRTVEFCRCCGYRAFVPQRGSSPITDAAAPPPHVSVPQ